MSLLGKNNGGSTAVMLASEKGRESTVRALLAAGANIEGK
jgi:ankyrin repeat protein